MTQKALADKTVRKYGTRDPFRIAEGMGAMVFKVPLNGIRGFYQYIKRCHIIYLDATRQMMNFAGCVRTNSVMHSSIKG